MFTVSGAGKDSIIGTQLGYGMKIREMFGRGRPLFSFEFFPAKTPEGERQLFQTLAELKGLGPDFVSVTYGAGGSARGKSVEWVERIGKEVSLEAMAHLTCADSSRYDLEITLQKLQGKTQNILALRGDPPRGQKRFEPAPGGFSHANELVAFIRERFGDTFCLGGAAYPEGHPESDSLQSDLANLKLKVEAGLDFLITQLFFDNQHYFRFVERLERMGVGVPVVAGIMPVTNAAQVWRFTKMCGASIPASLLSDLEKAGEDESAVLQVGVEYATGQVEELLAQGAPGIHFYTLNKSPASRRVLENLKRAGVQRRGQ